MMYILFKKCTTLQALELKVENNISCKLLSHFPSLRYCRLIKGSSTCVQEIFTTCKMLRCFCCPCLCVLPSPLVHNNLQQLCIVTKEVLYSEPMHLDDFMQIVSAHGGLIHVVLAVGSVTSTGVVTLIENSPNLLSFILCENALDESLSASLRSKFSHRKLFTSGIFVYAQTILGGELIWLRHTDLSTLWPVQPDYFNPRKSDTLCY